MKPLTGPSAGVTRTNRTEALQRQGRRRRPRRGLKIKMRLQAQADRQPRQFSKRRTIHSNASDGEPKLGSAGDARQSQPCSVCLPGKGPGLGQRPRAGAQEGAQIGGLAGFELDVDDGAKPFGVRVRDDEGAHDRALARRGNDLDEFRIGEVIGEVAAGEIDNETARARRGRLGRAERCGLRVPGVQRPSIGRERVRVEARERR